MLFVMYFWGFTLLRPILQRYESFSTHILFVYALVILSISLILRFRSSIVIHSYILLFGVVCILLCDLLFRPNEYITKYIYEFIIYGIIPVHLISQITDTKKLLKLYTFVSLFSFLLYFRDPLNGYVIFADYMSFGFNLAVPAYFGLYIGRRFLSYKWLLVFEVVCLIEIIVFANRSSMISIAVFWILIELFCSRRSKKSRIKIVMALLCLAIGLFMLEDILSFLISILNMFGIFSYSLRRIQLSLMQGDWSYMFSGRLEIWKLAEGMIKENYLIGSGTGAFQAKYAYYSHNLYYDIMVQYGVFGMIGLIGLIIKSFIKMLKQQNFYSVLLGVFLFSLWFPKLFFSLYIFKDIGIWCFLSYGFLSFNNKTFDKKINIL